MLTFYAFHDQDTPLKFDIQGKSNNKIRYL